MSDILQNEVDIEIEYDNVIEYQIDEYVFLQYSYDKKEFYIQYINSDLEEEILIIDENDFPLMVSNVSVSLEDFLYFKTLI